MIDSLDILSNAGEVIPNNSDLDDYSTPGKYYIGVAADAATMENIPSTAGGCTLFVIRTRSSSERFFQFLLYPTSTGLIYLRYYSNTNGFSSWRSI